MRSDQETMNRRLDREPEQILDEPNEIVDLTNPACSDLTKVSGMWRFPPLSSNCCIYRVPHRLRRVNPEAYTPQLVLIGPLHHSTKSQALKSLGSITDTKFMGYLNMEEYKKIYLVEFAKRVGGNNTIDEFRREIARNEEKIRESYSESTLWIQSLKFVEMILLDSVFIIEHMLRICNACCERSRTEKTGDLIVDDPCLRITIKEDLMLLENQLPYFILEELFDPIIPRLPPYLTLRELIICYFGFDSEMIKAEIKFIHFTDLHRCIRVGTLGLEQPSNTVFRSFNAELSACMEISADMEIRLPRGPPPNPACVARGSPPNPSCCDPFSHAAMKLVRVPIFSSVGSSRPVCMEKLGSRKIKHMYNAEKLYSAGVEFVAVEKEWSIDVRFKNGCLEIPHLWVRDDMELILRNIMALEQCHYPFNAYVCNFVTFLDFLIDSGKDVDLLIETGILHNWIGEDISVAEMVNKLTLGIVENGSHYYDIARQVNAYYESRCNRTRAILAANTLVICGKVQPPSLPHFYW